MKREDLEHVIRAAGAIAQSQELLILGSQAILGKFPHAPPELVVSQEVDTYPLDDPGKADLIDGTIGELSPFHEAFGYYAHGVGPETAHLPRNWRDRLIAVRGPSTQGVTGFCLGPADLAISKLLAARPRDLVFVAGLLDHHLVAEQEIMALLPELPPEDAARARETLQRCRPESRNR